MEAVKLSNMNNYDIVSWLVYHSLTQHDRFMKVVEKNMERKLTRVDNSMGIA